MPHTALESSGLYPSRYTTLPEPFFARVAPTPVAAPSLVALNRELARELSLSVEWLESEAGVSVLAGNASPAEIDPIAMAYAGHQFGNWVPSLGDGRAIQIGEAVDAASARWGLQLKGAGPTPFSRRGDGRAAIGPVLREYVLSEAMFALGIPTTRALAFVSTGEPVLRERPEPGAILTRVARGFVRVGTFEYFAARGGKDDLRTLADFVIEQRYPECAETSNPHAALLERVVEVQAELIAHWMLVGFIHGVMNTDNMSIFGETIDYGPCAFLDEYDPNKVFSSIDVQGRYAYAQQPSIGLWNLTRFAETLVPLLAEEREPAIELAQEILGRYASLFHEHYEAGLLRKLGLVERNESNRALAFELLDAMSAGRADFTLTFRALSSNAASQPEDGLGARSLFDESEAFDVWAKRWQSRLLEEGVPAQTREAEMLRVNPRFIPRNHRVQQAIDAWVDRQDRGPFDDLVTVTSQPFEEHPELADHALPPEPHEVVRQTFCGT